LQNCLSGSFGNPCYEHRSQCLHYPKEMAQRPNNIPGPSIREPLSISDHSSERNLAESPESGHRPFCGHVLFSCSKYPWEHACFPPWTIFFPTPFVFDFLSLLIYTVAFGTVHNCFELPTHAPPTNSSTHSQFTFNITSSGGDILIANFDPGNGLLWKSF
jgi:hypothetical protein